MQLTLHTTRHMLKRMPCHMLRHMGRHTAGTVGAQIYPHAADA